ncbi:Peptidase C12, ubiquitin carboxyl-terminal hydrolase [Cinara cedri]|uniref:Ubiquitin carboxyl-terminal hydrolase n=1 Tax=Cinara cedri TaxID=506608 RepID=A0A5E4NRC5_9HEMI|nr:Peptidase C12, ubiquitin carboxyl-terminal hydrolase [Cinara cedri]
MLSRKTKVRLYVAIIRPTLTYGCEAWTTTKQVERNLRTIEHRVWRKICGPVFDETMGNWRRRYNRELYYMLDLAPVTSFIKSQRIQWLGHIMRRRENKVVRGALEWKPQDKGQEVSDDIYFVKQYVHNACGTMALIHSVANNRDKIQLEDGILKRFLDEGQNMSPSDRGEMLTKAEDIINTHREIAIEGQTQPPEPEDNVPYHFVAFVCKDGCLYELDGGKFDPINHGSTTPDSLLEDTVSLVQEKYVVKDPDSIYFSLLALSNICDAY